MPRNTKSPPNTTTKSAASDIGHLSGGNTTQESFGHEFRTDAREVTGTGAEHTSDSIGGYK
jgi:hypothetical protein